MLQRRLRRQWWAHQASTAAHTTPSTPTPTQQVAAVVVGFDRNINYYKIQYATLCIRENPGCRFIATNTGGWGVLQCAS